MRRLVFLCLALVLGFMALATTAPTAPRSTTEVHAVLPHTTATAAAQLDSFAIAAVPMRTVESNRPGADYNDSVTTVSSMPRESLQRGEKRWPPNSSFDDTLFDDTLSRHAVPHTAAPPRYVLRS